MFQEYYNFTLPPFQLTPDHRFFFGSSVHSRAIAHLVYGLAQEEGFIIITGEVGAGKTTLVERLAAELDMSRHHLARIVTSQVSGDDLLRLVASAFGITESYDKATLLRQFEALLRANRAEGRRTLLVVDEVQSLPMPALEELRMLSNITDGGRAFLQTILLGQPQFRRTLASPDLDQLRQRVLASYHLGPLSEEETRAYIEYRLKAAGWAGNPNFEEGAFSAIYRHTGGVPRRINRLCSRVLLYGALEETSLISLPMVETTARELHDDLGAGTPVAVTPEPGQSPHLPYQPPTFAAYDLMQRVQALEQVVARRERIFERLLDLLGASDGLRR